MASLTHNDYTIAWICALPLEAAAARVMLNKTHSPLPQPSTDTNAYELGELNGHYIVIACLPVGVYGTVSAAAVVSRMCSTFPRLQYGLMVGIGGGVPNKYNDIRLGDVVVSKPDGNHSGVIQYDYGKTIQDGQFELTGTLNKPPQTLLTHMGQVESKQMTESDDALSKIIWETLEQNPSMKKGFSPPQQHTDLLFHSSYHHTAGEDTCEKCDKEKLIKRQPRGIKTSYIHHGLIASGDQVMKNSETRDRLAQRHGILCFEMEAAGLMDELPTLVIRGICDYCDSHKQKQWQGYAALTAAAYAKLLLSVIPISYTDVNLMKSEKIRHWVVSLPRNPKFAGRENEIKKLEELITMQDGPRRVAITGLGGIGKTQVALELAYRIRDRDQECSVFWIPCTSRAMIEQMLIHIAQILGLRDINPVEVQEKIKTYLSSEHAGKWLLIFDNVDEADMWFAESHTAPPLEDFLPENEKGRILITTRNKKLAMKLAPFNVVSIPDVHKETAVQILERTLANENMLKDTTTIAALLEQLAFLPLAITQASAYIIENGINLSTYLALFQDQERDAVELLSEDFRDPGRYKDIQNPVITTWLISFKQIQHQDQLAIDYLSFIACIDPRNIPQSLLPHPTSSKKQRIDALGLLNAYSFINGQDMNISMHRLVHIATRNWLRKNALFSHWIQQVADQMQKVFPDNRYTNRVLWREYLPHALALVHANEFILQENLGLAGNIADCLASDGRYQEAEVLYKNIMRINHDKAGSEHPDTLSSMANLASTYWSQGRLNEAEKLNLQLIKTRKTKLGAKHPNTLSSMANLVTTYQNQGRWNEAEELNLQVIEISKTILGPNHPDTLISIANLAFTYQNQGRWSEAEQLNLQVIETSKTIFEAEHPITLATMNNLALTYQNQGRWDEAEQLNLQVIEKRKRALGAEHPNTLTSMNNLALTYWNQDRWNEAEKLHIQIMETRKTVLGAEHPNTLISMNNLALTYQDQGRWNEAEKLNLQVIEKRRRVLGAEHPNTLTSMNNLAYTWKSLGKLQDAISLMEECSSLRSKVLGPSHPDYRSSSHALSDWMDEYKALPDQIPLPLTGKECPQPLQEVSAESPAAMVATQSACEQQIHLPHTQGRPSAKLLLGNHPLIIAARTPSPGPEGQDLQDLD